MKENNGVIRTKRALKHALVSLLSEKELREITIKEIVTRASYARGTFYAHYQYKEELLDELIQETIDGFTQAFVEPYESSREAFDVKQLTHSTVIIFEYIQENKAVFSVLFKGRNTGFQERLGEAIREIFDRELHFLFPHIPSHINRDLFINNNVFSVLGLISYWVRSNFMYSAQYMTEQMLEMAKVIRPR
ncbi:TetR/AcrR family transcriptional regulator C-terminal domain-containing protein [Paenibacillus sp. FSL K6-1230]|uniref:TetR/AcrR family transcriptional regulator C-terminal domain-containing protein n=1 Tax=Paenibacillus sp. FSL K6-1230 TaxID=2921603 RepID=UPI0003A8E8F2